MIEFRMHGRGGQGTVVASKILAVAAFKTGKYVQSFPQFGVERRGAPVTAFVRIGEPGELFVRSFIYTPDLVVVLDPTLLTAINVLEGLKKGGWVLVNTPEPPEKLQIPETFSVATVDATAIALKYQLGTRTQPIVNTAILGGLARVLEWLPLEKVEEAIREEVPTKPEENAAAARDAFEAARLFIPTEVAHHG